MNIISKPPTRQLIPAIRNGVIQPIGEAPPAADGATISMTHPLVELVLADTTGHVAERILPNRDAVLQRSASFLELYPPLRLSEEADLIVAGITGSVTVGDVAAGSAHDPEEVLRLEAALVATGILEASAPVIADDDLDWPSVDLDDDLIIMNRNRHWRLNTCAATIRVGMGHCNRQPLDKNRLIRINFRQICITI